MAVGAGDGVAGTGLVVVVAVGASVAVGDGATATSVGLGTGVDAAAGVGVGMVAAAVGVGDAAAVSTDRTMKSARADAEPPFGFLPLLPPALVVVVAPTVCVPPVTPDGTVNVVASVPLAVAWTEGMFAALPSHVNWTSVRPKPEPLTGMAVPLAALLGESVIVGVDVVAEVIPAPETTTNMAHKVTTSKPLTSHSSTSSP